MGGKSAEGLRLLQPARYLHLRLLPEQRTRAQSSGWWGATPSPTSASPLTPPSPQASQLGVYRAFVDNYGVAMETAEKCCQANAQFAEISEVTSECLP